MGIDSVVETDPALLLEQSSSNGRVHVVATRAAVEMYSLHELAFETQIPGYDSRWSPGWVVDGGGAKAAEIELRSDTGSYKTSEFLAYAAARQR